jgi:hypothetical protein
MPPVRRWLVIAIVVLLPVVCTADAHRCWQGGNRAVIPRSGLCRGVIGEWVTVGNDFLGPKRGHFSGSARGLRHTYVCVPREF